MKLLSRSNSALLATTISSSFSGFRGRASGMIGCSSNISCRGASTACYYSVVALLATNAEALLIPGSAKSPLTYRRIESGQSLRFYTTNKVNTLASAPSFLPYYIQRSAMSSSVEASSAEKDAMDIALNYKDVEERVRIAADAAKSTDVRLVAVSKTKPIELLQAAYDAGCRYFGENYVQEMVDKVPNMPPDVQWHFIGALQSNKCSTLVKSMDGSIERLTVETVSNTKLANKLNNAVETSVSNDNNNQRLKVFVQVNTSAEDSKSGVEPGAETVELCRHIVNCCPKLELRGLMTIGAIGDLSCFTKLVDCKNLVANELSLSESSEVSMGMSGDFEAAIAAGATNVRVGSTIFGERDYANKN